MSIGLLPSPSPAYSPLISTIVFAASPTSLGNQDYTSNDLGGKDCTGALIFAAPITSYDSEAASESWSITGIGTDGGTAKRWVQFADEDGQATMDARRAYRHNDYSIPISNGNFDLLSRGKAVTLLTNGVRINWVTADTTAYKLVIVLFAGKAVHCGYFQPSTSIGGSVDITGMGKSPGGIFTFSALRAANGASNENRMSIGMIDSAWNQYSSYRFSDDGVTTNSMLHQSTQYGATEGQSGAYFDFSAHADGFSVETLNAVPATDYYVYMAFMNVDSSVIERTSGSATFGSAGFTPTCAITMATKLSSNAPTSTTSGDAEEMGLGFATSYSGTMLNGAVGGFANNGVGTSDTAGEISNTDCVRTRSNKGSVSAFAEGTMTMSYTSSGSDRMYHMMMR